MLMIPAVETSSPSLLVTQPVVSVILMTRNHSLYIEEAVSSILMQRTEFPIEIIIGEDYSDDDTLKICLELQRANPEHIRVISASENVGITPNFLRLVARARGKYCALLEGDDYWISKDKLSLQVSYMERNTEWVWCGSRTINRTWCMPTQATYDLYDHVKRYIFHTSSVLFRTNALTRYPRFPNMVGWISMVYIYLAQQGTSGFIDETLSYYRHHPGGLWWGKSTSDQFNLTTRFTATMRSHLSQELHPALTDREFWIFHNFLDRRIDGPIASQTARNLALFRKHIHHLWQQSKTKTTLLFLEIAIQPLTLAIKKTRRHLAIRTKLQKVLVKWRD